MSHQHLWNEQGNGKAFCEKCGEVAFLHVLKQNRWPELCRECHFPEEQNEFMKKALIAAFQGIKTRSFSFDKMDFDEINEEAANLWRVFALARGDCAYLTPGVCQCKCHNR